MVTEYTDKDDWRPLERIGFRVMLKMVKEIVNVTPTISRNISNQNKKVAPSISRNISNQNEKLLLQFHEFFGLKIESKSYLLRIMKTALFTVPLSEVALPSALGTLA